jgi:hypothetical protein
MVVEGEGKRLAIECDGDRYHPMEKLVEDMDRQSVLERLGWQFVRIRGSAFYRDQELAMRPVFDRLAEIGIMPGAYVNEGHVSDMTLIHELDDLIRSSAEVEQPEEGLSTETSDIKSDDALDEEFEHFSTILDINNGQVEALLDKIGGVAPLEMFLRDLAKAQGFQRLGSNVKKGLKSELELLVRRGKITINNGIIRLL